MESGIPAEFRGSGDSVSSRWTKESCCSRSFHGMRCLAKGKPNV